MKKSLAPLVVVFLVLVGLVLLKQSNKHEPTIVEQVSLTPLVPEGLGKADIARLELYAGANPDEKTTIQRSADDPDVWRVTSHFNAPADKDKIEEFVGKTIDLKGELRATVADDAGLAPYSLADDAAFHVKGYKADSEEPAFDVLVGKAPAFNQVFMRAASGKDVYTLDVNLRRDAGVFQDDDPAAAPKAEHWLKKDVVNIAKNTINKVSVQTPDKKIVVVKEKTEVPIEAPATDTAGGEAEPAADGAAPAEGDAPADETPKMRTEEKWVLAEGGAGLEVKQAGVENLAGAFAPLSATDIVDPAKLPEWGLESPAFTCSISVEGKEGDVVLEGGRPDPNGDGYIRVASADASVIFKVSKFTFEKVFPKGTDFVNLPGLTIDKATISRIDITQPSGTIAVVKNGEEWTVESPTADLNPQDSSIEAIATAVSAWKPSDYADAADGKGLDSPTRTVTVTTTAGSTHSIALGGDSLGIAGAYAQLDGGGATLIMSKGDMDRVFVEPKNLYERTLLDIDELDIAGIIVERPDDSFTLNRDGEDAWSLSTGGEPEAADADAADDLAMAIAGFQASDIHFGVPALEAAPVATLRVTMNDGATHVFHFGEIESDSQHVALEGKQQIFHAMLTDVNELLPASETLKKNKPAPTPEPSEEPAAEPAPAEGVSVPMETPDEPAPESPAEPVSEIELTPDVSATDEAPAQPEAASEEPAATEEAPASADETAAAPAEGEAAAN